MWAWLRRLFDPSAAASTPTVAALPPPAELPAGPPPAPQELVETLESCRKNARAQAKLAARVDEVHDALAAQLDDVRAALQSVAAARPPASAPAAAWNEVLDAMDLLQHAIDALPPERDDGLAEGLRGVLRRLDRALAVERIERRGEVGGSVDGRIFRVIGTEPHPSLAEGRIARVVRAAALLDGKVLREGEVFSSKGSP